MRVVFRYFGIAASFMTKKTREAWILLYGFLKGIISGKMQRKDNYAYENNGRPCGGKYEYEVTEYTFPCV